MMIKNKRLKIVIRILLILIGVYLIGPRPNAPQWDLTKVTVPSDPEQLEAYITQKEATHNLKPDNEARIIWADSIHSKTPYSLIYLHGFSASQKEGDPIHLRFAKDFGCNLFLARLADHGIDTTEVLLRFTVDRFWESAKEALAIGKALGEKVIVMSTSTGSTAALVLAAEFPEDVYALINMSPNIALRNPAAFILNNPWGLHIARLVEGGKYREWEASNKRKQYWNTKYRIESLVQLEEMLETKMDQETFEKVTQPSLTMYYYKNEEEQDPEVDVCAIQEMVKQLGTPKEQNISKSFPEAGAHVIGSPMTSDAVEAVYQEAHKFGKEVLKLQ